PDVETSQDQPVSVVETSSEILQTDADIVLRPQPDVVENPPDGGLEY
ncbi:hypothetical protein A2U01_0066136, partial [Trifolium medium]|nr:hypothetical protein [Trifolium medium]